MRLIYCNFLVLLLILLAIPSATPDTPSKAKDRNLKRYLLQSSAQRFRDDRYLHRGGMTAHLAISKRAHSLQIHHMKVRSMAVPVIRAASALTVFYSIVLRECVSKWAHIPPLYVVRITNGFFALELYSTTSPIPWALVAEVASNMLAVTEMGFTGTYDIWYADRRFMRTATGVLVQFRIWDLNARAGMVVVDTPLGRIPM